MERIAIISDIHGNSTALETVIADIEAKGIKRIFCLGDIILKGPSSAECLDIVKQKCEIVVKGNVDEIVNSPNSDHKKWGVEQLGKERCQYLNTLPLYYDFYLSGSFVRIFHASKTDTHHRILDFAPVEEKMELFKDEKQSPDIILYGDIHIQYMQKFFNKTLVNVGSVGNVVEFSNHDKTIDDMSETIQAYYTILEGEYQDKKRNVLSIQFVRIPYAVEKEIEIAKQKEMPGLEKYVTELTTATYRKNILKEGK